MWKYLLTKSLTYSGGFCQLIYNTSLKKVYKEKAKVAAVVWNPENKSGVKIWKENI